MSFVLVKDRHGPPIGAKAAILVLKASINTERFERSRKVRINPTTLEVLYSAPERKP